MIVTSVSTDELKDHQSAQDESEKRQLPGEPAPPPSYSPPEQYATASTSSSNTLAQPGFKSKPTNHLYLFNENSSIRGEYIIDPCMIIPASLLPPLSPEESKTGRKNLCLNSKHASVDADVWLLSSPNTQPPDSKARPERTILDLVSEHGSVTARVQTMEGAAPFLLTISANHGTAHVFLPRSFAGLLLLTTKHGSISLSDALSKNCTHLSQVDSTRRYFIGDLSMADDNDWAGDEVRVESIHGKIKVKYVNEDANVDGITKGGLLNKLFGQFI